MAPVEDTFPWNENGVKACYKLLNTVWNLSEKLTQEKVESQELHINTLIKNISNMYQNIRLNTAVSEIMIFINNIKNDEKISSEVFVKFLKCLAPLAPFITEELYQRTNNTEMSKETSIHTSEFPKFDEKILSAMEINLPIQVNGKLISIIQVPQNLSQNEVLEKARQNEKVMKILEGKEISKIVFIQNKIISIII
jgi:leucyl-tRNA synthetase